MKFLSFARGGTPGFGVVTDTGVVDLGARHADLDDLRDAIRAGRLQELGGEPGEADFALSDVTFLPTIPNPEKIICIGVNYANRNAEYKDDSQVPNYPSVFMRSRESFSRPRAVNYGPTRVGSA